MRSEYNSNMNVILGAFILTSVFSLCGITYDRLTAIVLPQETRLTKKGTIIVIVSTWLAGIGLASPLYFYRFYKERVWIDFREMYCVENLEILNIYWHVIISMMVWIPMIIMLTCYTCIYIKLDKYEKKIKSEIRPVIKIRYKKRVVKTMVIVVLTFIICHLPFTVIIFYRHQLLKASTIAKQQQVEKFVNTTMKLLAYISRFLLFTNAAANPIIYGLTNEKFRRALKGTPIVQWIFLLNLKAVPLKCNNEKKNKTKETILDSSKNKRFVIFKSPFFTKKNKEVVPSEMVKEKISYIGQDNNFQI